MEEEAVVSLLLTPLVAGRGRNRKWGNIVSPRERTAARSDWMGSASRLFSVEAQQVTESKTRSRSVDDCVDRWFVVDDVAGMILAVIATLVRLLFI